MAWYNKIRDGRDFAIYTVVSLKRNIKDYPFPAKLDKNSERELAESVLSRLSDKGFSMTEIKSLSKQDITALTDEKVLTPGAKYLISDDGRDIFISVCADNHIEIRNITSGFDLAPSLSLVYSVEDVLDENLDFVFDGKIGYITSSPYDLGCALNITSLLFLPALFESGKITLAKEFAEKSGLELKESSERIYTLSNALSLGHTEDGIKDKMIRAFCEISELERSARDMLALSDKLCLQDSIMRAYGIAEYALSVNPYEFEKIYSLMRLGIIMGISGYNTLCEKLDEMYLRSSRTSLNMRFGKDTEASAARAKVLNEIKLLS